MIELVHDTVTSEDAHKIAEQSLTRPTDAGFWDDRLFSTHGVTISWAERGDDILAESNYHTFLTAVQAAAVHSERDPDEDVIDATISHWAVGSLRQCFVRVYLDDEKTAYTPSFIEAVSLGLALQDYPVLDESDYSERECAAFDKDLSEALAWTRREIEDTEEQEAAIEALLFESADHQNGLLHSGDGDGGCDWSAVDKAYREARDLYFTALGNEIWTAPIEGQLSL